MLLFTVDKLAQKSFFKSCAWASLSYVYAAAKYEALVYFENIKLLELSIKTPELGIKTCRKWRCSRKNLKQIRASLAGNWDQSWCHLLLEAFGLKWGTTSQCFNMDLMEQLINCQRDKIDRCAKHLSAQCLGMSDAIYQHMAQFSVLLCSANCTKTVKLIVAEKANTYSDSFSNKWRKTLMRPWAR